MNNEHKGSGTGKENIKKKKWGKMFKIALLSMSDVGHSGLVCRFAGYDEKPMKNREESNDFQRHWTRWNGASYSNKSHSSSTNSPLVLSVIEADILVRLISGWIDVFKKPFYHYIWYVIWAPPLLHPIHPKWCFQNRFSKFYRKIDFQCGDNFCSGRKTKRWTRRALKT